jgi:hypothetical protein
MVSQLVGSFGGATRRHIQVTSRYRYIMSPQIEFFAVRNHETPFTHRNNNNKTAE